MARILALEWDSREARVVVAQRKRGEIAVERAFAVEIRADAAGDGTPSESQLASKLAAALGPLGLGRVETLVGVGRSTTELRTLNLPPAPPSELPDLVRFQAMKQFSALGDDWPLDFVPLGDPSATSVTVLAAAISTDQVAQIRKVCGESNLEPTRLVLRPFAAAGLFRLRRKDERCVLMVDLLADEADLTVVAGGNVEFIRSIRLPTASEGEELAKQMIGELRRTMAAASNQIGGRKVELIVICGDSADHGPLKTQIEQQLALPVEYFDPFEGTPLATDAQSTRPPHIGRYAPLLGMLVCEASGTPHEIDFLHPRRRPPPPNHRRRNAIYASVGGVLALAIAFYYWQSYSELDAKVQSLNGEIKELQGDLKRLEPVQAKTQDIDEFSTADITWLDELREISEKFPSPEDGIVAKLSFGPASRGGTGGMVSLGGNVRSSAQLGELEGKLRDDNHRVDLGNGRYDERNSRLPWTFSGTIGVSKGESDEPDSKPRTDTPAAKPRTDAPAAGRAKS